MRVYLDTCCINRVFDDQASERVRQETRAIQVLLDSVTAGDVTWVASDLIRLEVSRIRDANRRTAVEFLLESVGEWYTVDLEGTAVPNDFTNVSLGGADAIHLLVAMAANCDQFLTVDDRLVRRCQRLPSLALKVLNPVEWLRETQEHAAE